MSNLQIVQLREVRCDMHHRISCHLPLSRYLSLCVLLSLCRIIDRLQLEALSEIIIIRLNALAATVLQSCFLSITHALSQPVSLSLSPPAVSLTWLSFYWWRLQSIYCPLLFGIAHSPLPLAAPTLIQFLAVPPSTLLSLCRCILIA